MPPLPGSLATGAGTATGAPITDQRGQPRSGGIDIGAFQGQGSTLVVNTPIDGVGSAPGQLSLRQSLNLSNALTTADSVTFSGLFNSAQTITLTAGQLELTDKATTTITGPGPNLLSISGNDAFRVFALYGGSATLSGLTITCGDASNGGGLLNDGGTLSMSNAIVTNTTLESTESGNGGGLDAPSGTTTLTNVTFLHNVGFNGGGLSNGGTMSLTDCTFNGNQSSLGGGLFNDITGTLSLTDCAIFLNACFGGGGVYSLGVLTMVNCTVVGNNLNGGRVGGIDQGHVSGYNPNRSH